MIIKDRGLADISYKGDQFIYTHYQDIEPTLAEIQLIQQNSTDGFSGDRTQRHVGHIPASEWIKHPEWNHEPELILRWLRSDEGRQYQVHKIDSGRSGKIIIK